MGGDRLAVLPKGTSRKPGKKLLCGVGKRKGSSSWVSGVTAEVVPAAVSAMPLESQNHLLPIAPAGVHKMQPAEDSQYFTDGLLSDVCDQCKKPPMVWVGSSDCHTYSSKGWPGEESTTTSALQDQQHLKTLGMPDRFIFAVMPTGHFLGFVHSHKLCGRAHSYCIHNPDQLTLTSSHSRNEKTEALLKFCWGGSYLQRGKCHIFLLFAKEGKLKPWHRVS